MTCSPSKERPSTRTGGPRRVSGFTSFPAVLLQAPGRSGWTSSAAPGQSPISSAAGTLDSASTTVDTTRTLECSAPSQTPPTVFELWGTGFDECSSQRSAASTEVHSCISSHKTAYQTATKSFFAELSLMKECLNIREDHAAQSEIKSSLLPRLSLDLIQTSSSAHVTSCGYALITSSSRPLSTMA